MKTSRLLTCCLAITFAVASTIALAADLGDDSSAGDATSTTAYMSDSTITAKVKAALLANTIPDISITTDQGVVTLSGAVENEAVRQRATRIAASVDGVRGVDYSGLSIRDKSAD